MRHWSNTPEAGLKMVVKSMHDKFLAQKVSDASARLIFCKILKSKFWLSAQSKGKKKDKFCNENIFSRHKIIFHHPRVEKSEKGFSRE